MRELVEPIIAEGIEATVSKATRETVEAVDTLRPDHHDGVPLPALSKHLRLDKSAASRRVKSAIELGYLKNEEDKKGRPARLRLGDPLPDKVRVLPSVDEVLRCCGVDRGDKKRKLKLRHRKPRIYPMKQKFNEVPQP